MDTVTLFNENQTSPSKGLEIPNSKCGNCRDCGSKLGHFMKVTKSGDSFRKVFWFSNKEHKHLKVKRTLCIDCFYTKEGRLPKQPNMPTYDLCSLLNVDKEEVSKLTKARAVTKDILIERYGLSEGSKRWESYCNKQAYTASTEYFVNEKGMTEEEAKEFHNSRAATLENLIRRHGEELGKEKYDSYVKAQEYTKSLQRYIDEFGEVEGTKKFNLINDMKSNTVNGYMKKGFTRNQAIEKVESMLAKGSYYFSSPMADNFFSKLCENVGLDVNTVYCNESILGEYYVLTDEGFPFYDFVDVERGLCIEFHGDYWHCNPKTHKPDTFNTKSKKTAQQIWDKDAERKKLIESKGFKLEVVWESDYNERCDEIIEIIKRKYYANS